MIGNARALALISVLWLAGCQRALFDQPPAVAACDPQLTGEWLAEEQDHGDSAPETLRLHIDDHCQLSGVHRQAQGDTLLALTPLGSAEVDGRRYAWVAADWANRHFDVDPGLLDGEGSVYLFAYAIDDTGNLRVTGMPVRTLAAEAIDKRVEADLLQQGDDLAVRVRGDAEATRAALKIAATGEQEKALLFTRVRPTPAAGTP